MKDADQPQIPQSPIGPYRVLRVLGSGSMARVSLAIQWIRQDFARPIRVETLARKAAMSVSAFHRHFKAVTTLSPLQYQKRVRLLQARTLMVASGRSVTSAAFEVGYESATQFSRDYARVFGLPPARDSARILGETKGRGRSPDR